MKKTTFTKLFALAVAVIVIAASLTAGFGAFAAAPADSEASYYNEDGKGIRATLIEYPFQLKPVDQISNLDFEDGFRFWAGGVGKGTYGDTAFDIETDGDNSYGKIPATGYVSNFQTALFKIENVAAGDKIVVVYDVKGADGDKIRVKVEQEYVKSIAVFDETTGLNTTKKADGTTPINVTPGAPVRLVATGVEPSNFAVNLTDGWTTRVTSSDNALSAPSAASAYTSDPIADAFYIKLTVTCGDSGVAAGNVIDAAIDNIRIAKVADGVYTDVVTNTVIYDPNANQGGGDGDDNQGGNDNQGATSIYGAADKGFDSGTNAEFKLKPVDGFKNLDFSEGFVYWSGRNGGGNDSYASDCFDLVTEGDNKYLKVKSTGWVTSIRSAIFRVEGLADGDTVGVLYDVKGADGDTFHIKLSQIFLKQGVNYDETTGVAAAGAAISNSPERVIVGSGVEASDFKWNFGAEGWTTRNGARNLTVKAPDADADQNYYFQVTVTSDFGGASAGDTLDAAIDNLRIVKVVDGVYYNVLTGAEITETSDGSTTGGSTTGGSTTGGSTTGGSTSKPGAGASTGNSDATGDSVLMLAALFFISGAAVFGTVKALKKSR